MNEEASGSTLASPAWVLQVEQAATGVIIFVPG